ncbi:hypothetical protein BDW02DRAFT_576985 [Decorospora gaudefroyi]|uniref:Uncharacterized protein n=1 Tax=Decorospora gaudefroyi TaxID=184978 RepID=A0A6A5KKS4_9PLEO|nr:hypothetical protein BDW02DRAFT_576985 [Decorospora gaudefroyi]
MAQGAMDERVYQFVATAKECALIRGIRSVEQSITPVKQSRLCRNLTVSAEDEDGYYLGSCQVEVEDLMLEFVRAGAGFLEELVKGKMRRPSDPTEADEALHTDDRDSVLGTQDVLEDSPRQAEGELAQNELEKKKPTGIKQMIIELDETEVAQNPTLDSEMREKFPWATIESKPDPNTSRKRARRTTGTDSTTSRVIDPISHLEDFTQYATERPSDDEFGYSYPIGDTWDQLSYARKLEIAHARAIQQHHGTAANGRGCSHCAAQGYECKVYLPPLGNLSHIAFGHSCQNCRLQSRPCDLPAAIDERKQSIPSGSLRLDTQNLAGVRPRETPETPPTAVTPKPSLLSRMTSKNGIRLQEKVAEAEGDSSPITHAETPMSARGSSTILAFAEKLGLQLPEASKPTVHAMYATLSQRREAASLDPHKIALQHHYENLVNLYILTWERKEFDLAYVLLLHIQNTNYSCTDQLPGVEVVVHAFEYLKVDNPLCRWFAILFSFLWGNQSSGHYDEFMSVHEKKLKPEPLSQLLWEVAYIRDPLTMGGDAAVLRRWCEVHNHSTSSRPQDENLCQKMTDKLALTLAEAERIENTRMLDDARNVIARLEGGATPLTNASPKSPHPGGKRKAEDPPAGPRKAHKAYRGSGGKGRGRGRGASR